MSPNPLNDDRDLSDVDLMTVLQAVADPVRLEIVRQLAGCPEKRGMACGRIEVDVAKSTVTHHLKALHAAGVVSQREEGTRKLMSLRRDEMEARFPGLLESILRSAERAA
ncbi:MAG: ArsR/SmtB family transcription factor [Thermoleophilia bacterium]